MSKVQVTEGCWNWLGNINTKTKYGRYCKNYKQVLAHRYSYTIHVGELVDGMVIDHICRNRKCVNPKHLRQVTRAINAIENNDSPVATNLLKKTCPLGHELSYMVAKNRNPYRICKTCRNANAKKFRLKHRKV